MNNYQQEIKELLEMAMEQDASDLHISVGRYPTLRIDGKLIPLLKKKMITPERAEGFAFAILTPEQKNMFLSQKEIDFSYGLDEKARFRVNVFYQRGCASVALRHIPAKIKTIEELNLPPILHEFTRPSQGFFLMVGPTGQGKSTTLAALVDEINHTRTEHIVTIEDPIEYLFRQDRCIIDQREVHQDTESFHRALKSVFRQDANIVMVGEMRDPETMSTAVTAAETGHLIYATLHTNNAAQTIDRIIDSFPPDQQNQIRSQLANTLVGIVSQRLLPRLEGGRIPAIEVMIANSAIRNLIRENKIHQIDLVIETSAEEGMITLNHSLSDLVKRREISLENAEKYSLDPGELRTLL